MACVCSTFSSLPPNGGDARVHRDYLISHFSGEKAKAQRGGMAHTGACESPEALRWPDVPGSLPTPQLWWEWEQGHCQLAVRKLQGVDPLQDAKRAAQRS